MEINKIILIVFLLISLPKKVVAQTAQEVNEAKPLTPKITVNLHDFYTMRPSIRLFITLVDAEKPFPFHSV